MDFNNNISDNATGCLVKAKVKAKFPLRNKQKRRRSIDKVQTKGMPHEKEVGRGHSQRENKGVREGVPGTTQENHDDELMPGQIQIHGPQKETTTEATPLVSFTDHDHDRGREMFRIH